MMVYIFNFSCIMFQSMTGIKELNGRTPEQNGPQFEIRKGLEELFQKHATVEIQYLRTTHGGRQYDPITGRPFAVKFPGMTLRTDGKVVAKVVDRSRSLGFVRVWTKISPDGKVIRDELPVGEEVDPDETGLSLDSVKNSVGRLSLDVKIKDCSITEKDAYGVDKKIPVQTWAVVDPEGNIDSVYFTRNGSSTKYSGDDRPEMQYRKIVAREDLQKTLPKLQESFTST